MSQAGGLPRGLIVSCQAYAGEPLFGASIMAAMARAAVEGGAVAIRANSPSDIAAIRRAVDCPIIGLYKQSTPDSQVYITPGRDAAAAIAAASCDMIAIDATDRPRGNGETLSDLVAFIRDELKLPIMADIDTITNAQSAAALGIDVLSTTLSGYTEPARPAADEPDLELVRELVRTFDVPVVAEGRYREAWQVAQAFELGAHAVVIGGAITRPQDITRRFVAAIPATNTRIRNE